jgi:hypothetical protein
MNSLSQVENRGVIFGTLAYVVCAGLLGLVIFLWSRPKVVEQIIAAPITNSVSEPVTDVVPEAGAPAADGKPIGDALPPTDPVDSSWQ